MLRQWWLYAAAGAMIVAVVFCWRECMSGRMVSDATTTAEGAFQFNDLNPKQLASAKQLGISPAETRDELKKKIGYLVKISDNNYYKIDHLDYSMPYLTPGAEQLLLDIGKGFQERLKEGGFNQHRIIVTSALRSIEDQVKLSKSNPNAAKQSAHCYGTTFDITYTRFFQSSGNGRDIGTRQLANELGATLKELRDAGRCYVKYEMRQHCYHITTRE